MGFTDAQIAAARPRLDGDGQVTLAVWNACGGERIDWAGVQLLAAIHDVRDVETVVAGLMQIQTSMAERREQARANDHR